jgi:hypothetical protein
MAMPTEGTFRELIDRVRSGDEQAAIDLVRRYEPAIRRAARVRLSVPRLGRLLDSMDIWQSAATRRRGPACSAATAQFTASGRWPP